MTITVAICTWNRATLLAQTLESLCTIADPGVSWELLVVNNNSTDTTESVLDTFTDRLPLRRVVEATPGHSNARNRAIAEARGSCIVWADDDVLFGHDYLREYARAFASDDEAVLFAGPVEPWFESEPPAWFSKHLSELSGVIVCVDHGAEPRDLAPGETIFGANMAVRTVIARSFGFNTRLGRVGSGLIGGDDTDFFSRVMSAGHRAMWVPGARLKHFVPRQRLNRDYVDRWHVDSGRLVARQWTSVEGPLVGGAPRWLVRKLLIERAKALVWSPLKNDRWFRSHRQALMLHGMLLESRARTDEARTAA